MSGSISIEILISNEGSEELFQSVAKYLEQQLQVRFISKLSGIKQYYWVFQLNAHSITLRLEDKKIALQMNSDQSKNAEETVNALYYIKDVVTRKFSL
jgi:hypothetical protein